MEPAFMKVFLFIMSVIAGVIDCVHCICELHRPSTITPEGEWYWPGVVPVYFLANTC